MKYMSVNVKTKKGEETRATASVFEPKIRHMVANIYYALEFASLQNLFKTCNENRSSVNYNLIVPAISSA